MAYTDEQIKTIIKNVSNSDEGIKFIEILLDKLGAYERGCNLVNHEAEIFNKGRREQGLWLLDILMVSNFQKYIELQEKRRKNLCQKTKQLQQD